MTKINAPYRIVPVDPTTNYHTIYDSLDNTVAKTSCEDLAKLIAALPELVHALKSFTASMKTDGAQFVGQLEAYRIQVCLPRATEALLKAGI